MDVNGVIISDSVLRQDWNRMIIRKRRAKERARKIFVLRCMLITAILIAVVSIYGILVVNASDSSSVSESEPVKYYKSICVESGETLWDIALKYHPDAYGINSYIDDIKHINHMQSDTVYSGQNIIVYYLSE